MQNFLFIKQTVLGPKLAGIIIYNLICFDYDGNCIWRKVTVKHDGAKAMKFLCCIHFC